MAAARELAGQRVCFVGVGLPNIAVNLAVIGRYGIVGLAAASAASASLNCLLLYAMLHKRGWFHFTWKLAGRIARQIAATAAMSAALWYVLPMMAQRYGAGVWDRVWSLTVLVSLGMGVFFATAFLTGALDRQVIAQLARRRPRRTKADDEILEVQ